MKLRVTIDGQSYGIEVGDLNNRPIQVSVDGDTFEVWPDENGKATPEAVQEPVAQVVTVTVPAAVAVRTDTVKTVYAPIPGVILAVGVKEGDMVRFGQELCVLEAMKMKNSIRANRAGKIGAVCVAPGDQVNHHQVLMEYTD